ncbi:MAG TPA: XrtA system polysaccharide deacetylase [Gemmatimonadales bacterium]|nr:XrtA system polysaccharide deacetylase [Gemmatimonadales bacterium]
MTTHYFSVDVEEYFQVSAFEGSVPRDLWERLPSRVEGSVYGILDLLARHDARGTFFTLGWVAERHPKMIKRIAGAGHEIASHGWDHVRVTQQTPEEFRASVKRSKACLEDLAGAQVLGFRAPSFSIVPGREWALDILVEEGYRYDSSLFPIRRPGGYGYASAGRDPFVLERAAGKLDELPPATLRRLGVNLPAGGGAYFRIFPYALVQHAFRHFDARGVPGTFYMHPWEIDPDQPRQQAPLSSRLRHYTGLSRTLPRLERLLSEFRFTAIADRYSRSASLAAS